jgi:type III restriction enzyme
MSLAEQISRWMSLRAPQRVAVGRLDAIVESVEFKNTTLESISRLAVEKCGVEKMEFDTEFPSFCFALATGVGKTRLMGACMYDLWKTRGYRNFFILAPGSTIYEKLRGGAPTVASKVHFHRPVGFPPP